jgi:regulator of RNase E activity RraA
MNGEPLVARLRALDICDLSDALDALGLPPAVTGLVPVSGAKPIAGRAVTVKLSAGSPPAGAGRHLCTAAVGIAGPDDVIVVEQRTGIDAAGWGGILSCAAATRGIAGTIVEGPARDIEESVRLGYPVYARSATARTARGRIHESDFQASVRIGDTTVQPGDYVAADRSGCVVIPADMTATVLVRAEAIRAKSEAMAAAVTAGRPVAEVMSADYETMLDRE